MVVSFLKAEYFVIICMVTIMISGQCLLKGDIH